MPALHQQPVELRQRRSRPISTVSSLKQSNDTITLQNSPQQLQVHNNAMPSPPRPVELSKRPSKSMLSVSPAKRSNDVMTLQCSPEHLQIHNDDAPLPPRPVQLGKRPSRRMLLDPPFKQPNDALTSRHSLEHIQIHNNSMPPPPKIVELRQKRSRRILSESTSNLANNVTALQLPSKIDQIQMPSPRPSELAFKIHNPDSKPGITFDMKDANVMLWHEGEKVFETKLSNFDQPIQISVNAGGADTQRSKSKTPILKINSSDNQFCEIHSPLNSVELKSTRKTKPRTSNPKTIKGPKVLLQRPSTGIDRPVIPPVGAVNSQSRMATPYNGSFLSQSAPAPLAIQIYPPIANLVNENRVCHRHRHESAAHKHFPRGMSSNVVYNPNTNNRHHSHKAPPDNLTLANRFLLRPPEPHSRLDTIQSHDEVNTSRPKTRLLSTSRSFDGVFSPHNLRHTVSNQTLASNYLIQGEPGEEDAFAHFLHMTPPQGSFVYKDLDNTETQIRLIRIRPKRQDPLNHIYLYQNTEISCDIIHTSFEDHPPYLALSYTWGHPDDRQNSINLDDKAFQVKENLYHALNRLQTDFNNTYIWIDAICINQIEGVERNHQVGNMRKIYERAEKVLVWLGEEGEDSQHALMLANYLYQYRHSEKDLAEYVFKHSQIAKYCTALKLLFSRDYWKRIWVVQELTVATDVLVLCGSKSIPLQVLIEAQEVMKSDQGQRALALQPLEEDIWSQIKWKGPSSIEASRKGFILKELSLYEAIQYHYQKLASNPRDKIFALMGLANDVELHALKIDYSKSVAEVYYQFAIAEIKISLRLDLITKVQHDHVNRFNLPSWVPDWTFNKRAHVRLQNIRRPEYRYNASINTHANVSFVPGTGHIRMKGVQVGVVSHLGMPTSMQSPEDWKNGVVALRAWGYLLGTLEYRRGEQPGTAKILEEFARTLMCGHVTTEDTREGFLNKLLGAITYLIFQLYPDSMLSDVLKQYCHDEILSKPNDRQLGYAQLMALHAQEKLWDRRFFLTDRNQMGLAPQETTDGDIIFIPFGCSSPVVFRKNDAVTYRVIGECYVDGVMYGEAMENLKRNELKVMEFQVS